MSRREHLDARDVGISPVAAAALAPFLLAEEGDAHKPIRHFILSQGRKAPAYAPRRTACGLEGIEPNTYEGSEFETGITCPRCLAELSRRHDVADKRALARVRNAPVLVRKITRDVRDRLIAKGLVRINGAFVEFVPAPKKAAERAEIAYQRVTHAAHGAYGAGGWDLERWTVRSEERPEKLQHLVPAGAEYHSGFVDKEGRQHWVFLRQAPFTPDEACVLCAKKAEVA